MVPFWTKISLLMFLGPRGPLGTPLSISLIVSPQRKSRSPLQPYKSLEVQGPQLLVSGPSGRLDFVLRALRAFRPCDPRSVLFGNDE